LAHHVLDVLRQASAAAAAAARAYGEGAAGEAGDQVRGVVVREDGEGGRGPSRRRCSSTHTETYFSLMMDPISSLVIPGFIWEIQITEQDGNCLIWRMAHGCLPTFFHTGQKICHFH
jgi:hypothetical protein